MPFEETHVVDERRRFVIEAQHSLKSFSALCRRYGISRPTGYKWLERWEQDGPPGLQSRPSRPRSSPWATPPHVVEAILNVRRAHEDYGAKKIIWYLERHRPELPLPSPDGSALAYGSVRALVRYDLATRAEDTVHLAESGEADLTPLVWTAENGLLFSTTTGDTSDLRVWRRDSEITHVGRFPGLVRTGDFSPDGRRIALVMGPSLDDQRVQVASYPNPRAWIAISRPGATTPKWAPDGRSIYFWERTELVAVSVSEDGNPVPAERRTVLEAHRPVRYQRSFDVHPDGDSLVVLLPVALPTAQIMVVTGWLDSVRDLMR